MLFRVISTSAVPMVLSLLLSVGCHPVDSKQPNIVLIISDDQGYGDLGCHSNTQICTPNIDRLYGESTRLTRFYVSPVCAPTRASVMTGRYNYRTGVVATFGAKAMMEGSEVTIAERLRDAGYATGLFGKWHLGDHWPIRPTDQGFQEVLYHQAGGIGQAADPPNNTYFNPVLQHNNGWVKTTGYCTDIFFDEALRFIERNRSRPFFAYITPNTPHVPLQVDEQYVRRYRDMGLDNFTARIYGMCENLDDNVGRLLQALDDWSLRDNTIVIFMTDNGPQLYQQHAEVLDRPRYSAGMRGAKTTTWENGIRVPFFIRWPSRWQGGRDINRIAAHIDIMPTLLDVCGVSVPADRTIDGISLLPLLDEHAADGGAWPERILFFQGNHANAPTLYHNMAAVGQRYKLAQPFRWVGGLSGKEPVMLFDLEKDPGEDQDIAAQEPEIYARMKQQYEQWFTEVSATRGFHPVRIPVGSPHQEQIMLTLQTWRNFDQDSQGRPGAWVVTAERAGRYQFTAQFPQLSDPATVWLKAGGKERSLKVTTMAMSCTFDPIDLAQGDCDVESYLISDGKRVKTPYVYMKHVIQ